MIVLGLHFETHEASVALIKDKKILFTAAEERYSRIKMDNAAPLGALKECFNRTGIRPRDIDIVAVSGFPALKNWLAYAKCFIVQKRFTGGKDFMSFEYSIGGHHLVLRGLPALFVNLIQCAGLPQFFSDFLIRYIRMRLAL
ncbi:MAG: carbamoyltransferase N-terminal domain-containing protein [bacterium]|nr:carbamoyltransferase N-terminal domain-containing protein [bacterium]